MGQSVRAKLFYGVCLDPGEYCEYEKDEDGYDADRKPHLLDQITEKLGVSPDDVDDVYDLRKAGLDVPNELDDTIVGYDEGLRRYLIHKDSLHSLNSGELELPIQDLVKEMDDQPFRDFFDRIGLPFVQPQWLFGCLWF